jgi:DNA repair photolyase
LNDHEILGLAKTVADLGALGIGYTMVRLNDDVEIIFEDWLRKTLPDRADRILNRIRDVHAGKLSDFRPGVRMRGEGQIAEIIQAQFKLAREKYFKDRRMPPYNLDLHERFKSPQLSLF